MPEGPEVYRFAVRVRTALVGQEIRGAEARGPGRVPRVEMLAGATCIGVETRGKHIVIRFDNGLALHGHLGMNGSWRVYRPDEDWGRSPAQARLVLRTDHAVVVNFSAPVIELVEERAIAALRPVTGLGPDLLGEEFDVGEVVARFRDPLLAGQTIGDAIMNQRVMAGVGNMWKHETLFRCGLNPWTTLVQLSDQDLERLVTTARSLLRQAAGLPVSGLPPGRPRMYVYSRAGQPCLRCFTRIRRAPQGQDIRLTAWCPRCQAPRAP